MAAKTVAQRKLFGIAAHHPEKVYGRNRGVLSMSKKQMHEYASTSEKGLPRRMKKKR